MFQIGGKNMRNAERRAIKMERNYLFFLKNIIIVLAFCGFLLLYPRSNLAHVSGDDDSSGLKPHRIKNIKELLNDINMSGTIHRPLSLAERGPDNVLEDQILEATHALRFLYKDAFLLYQAVAHDDYEICAALYKALYEARQDLEQQFIPDIVSLDICEERCIIYDNKTYSGDHYLFYLRSGDIVIPGLDTQQAVYRNQTLKDSPLKMELEKEYFCVSNDGPTFRYTKEISGEQAAKSLLQELRIFVATMEMFCLKVDYSRKINFLLKQINNSDAFRRTKILAIPPESILLPETLEELKVSILN